MSKEDEFLQELKDLMIKYKCERMFSRDDYVGYPECGQDLNIVFEFEYDCGVNDFKIMETFSPDCNVVDVWDPD